MLNRSDDQKEKTTLILAPAALLEQWKEEIVSKTNRKLSVLIYHGSKKVTTKSDLRHYDVVVTTLGTLMSQWVPDDETAKRQAKNQAAREGDPWDSDASADWHEAHAKQTGLLFRMTWHRVVIDEAQNIRNRATKSSRAVHSLKSEFRWCLTGTP